MSVDLLKTDEKLNLPEAVQDQLCRVIQRLKLSARLRRISLQFTAVIAAIILLISIDLLYEPISQLYRFLMLIGIAGPTAFVCWWIAVAVPRKHDPLLCAAWTIESSIPEFEERITSAIELLKHDQSRNQSSGQLIDAMLQEADQTAGRMNESAVQTSGSWPLVWTAGCCAAVLMTMFAAAPESVTYSLANWMMPWRTPVFPPLDADVLPGDAQIIAGSSVLVELQAHRSLHKPTLELVQSADTITSVGMTETTRRYASLKLSELSQSLVYRIRSGSRVTRDFRIDVLERPVLESATATIFAPDYTQLGTATVDDLTQPLSVPIGSAVHVRLKGDAHAANAVLKWKDGTEQISPDMQFVIEAKTESLQSGELRLVSEEHVESDPFNLTLEVRGDSPPEIEISSPLLKHLELSGEQALELQFAADDDFGIATVELVVEWSDESGQTQQKSTSCEFAPVVVEGRQRWVGRGVCSFEEVPKAHTGAVVWMRVTDNRPESLGGAQSAESDRIVVDFHETASSALEQQVQTDTEGIQDLLNQAIAKLGQARENVDRLTEPSVDGATSNDDVEKRENELRENAEAAKQQLGELLKSMKTASVPYDRESETIREVRDEHVTKAVDHAFRNELSDDPAEKRDRVEAAASELDQAVQKLQELNSDLEQRSKDLELAAKLDDLATRQRKIANEAAKSQQVGDAETPDQNWRQRQRQIAEQLEAVQQQTREARQNRLTQQADEADQLAKEIERLEREQQASGESGQDPSQKQNGNPKQDDVSAEEHADSGKKNRQQPTDADQQSKEQSHDQQQDQKNGPATAKTVREESEKLSEQIIDSAEAREMAKEASRQLAEAERRAAENPEEARKALQKASESMKAACEACKSCSNCMNPGSGTNTTSGSPRPDAPRTEEIQRAQESTKNASTAAKAREASEQSTRAAEELAQLASKAADQSGLKKPNERANRPSPEKPVDSGSGRPGEQPAGTRSAVGDDVPSLELRGGTGSEWTRPRSKHRGNVMDNREAAVPDAFRSIVDRYFEELSRQTRPVARPPGQSDAGAEP